MSLDFDEGYLVGQNHLRAQQADRRLLDRLVQRQRPDPAAQAVAAWQQQCAALQGQVDILRAEVDKLAAENARLRHVLELGDVAIQETVERADALQSELSAAQDKAAKYERMYESTYRLLNRALLPDDCL